MKPYELLEHTADAKFRAYGKTLEEVFANAVKGMTAIVVDPETVVKDRKIAISVEANDLKRLLFEFLDQILFLTDTQKFLAGMAEDLQITKDNKHYLLNAMLCGGDIVKYGGNLKAVTYYDMLVEQQTDGTWIIQAVIDI